MNKAPCTGLYLLTTAPIVSWTTGDGDLGIARSILLLAHLPSGARPSFAIFSPSNLPSPFRLFDIPPSVTHFDLEPPEGPPTEWRGHVQYEKQTSAAVWEDYYLFTPTLEIPYELVFSAGSMR